MTASGGDRPDRLREVRRGPRQDGDDADRVVADRHRPGAQNLLLEIAPTDTFDDLVQRAQAQWDDKLGVIEVEGATEDQLTTLYSNLYRLFLYPNSAHENTGTRERPV